VKRNWIYFPFAGLVAVALLVWVAKQAFKSAENPRAASPEAKPTAPPAPNATSTPPPATNPAVEIHRFPGVVGPTNISKILPPVPTDWRRYSSGGTNRLAILLTDTDSAWLGLAHGLRTIGVPFLLTTNTAQALTHRVVFAYPQLSGALLTTPELRALAAHPRTGGTLIAANVLGGGLENIFGFQQAVASRQHYEIGFPTQHALTASFTHPRERVIRVAEPKNPAAVAGKYHYTQPAVPPLAIYEDGTAAILLRPWEAGYACALGFDPGYLLLLGHNNREEGIARAYVNQFEPSLDVLLRLFKELYRATASAPVTLGTVPFGRQLPVLITHDVDYTRSLTNALAYAEFEASVGVRATYFTQVKYLRDFNDTAFFNDTAPPFLQRIRALGHELASHTVCHSKVFSRFPLGTGTERYPDYQPFVRTPILTIGGSVFGELRASKFLLEKFGGQEIVSFRPGHLSNPYSLPQALVATGYRHSSSVTANDSLTHLPFQLNYDRARAAETPIFEFPVTIEDEEQPPLGQRVQAALDVARELARYGGLMNVLIHPDITGHKLQFERDFITALKPVAWFGTVNDFASWWTARNEVAVDVELSANFAAVTLTAPQPLNGLPLQVPTGWRLQSIEPTSLKVTPADTGLVLDKVPPSARLFFRR
jgi:peptidoglycan/xylan/chitin deacetylase (PgdA/CDA1 family)